MRSLAQRQPISRLGQLPTTIEGFEALERELLMIRQPEEQQLNHFFGDGVYVRELIIPAGRLVLGEIHKYRHVSIMITGRMMMWTSERGAFLAEAPMITVTPAGCKRVGFALTEVRFATAHSVPGISDWEPCDANIRKFLASKTLKDYKEFCESLPDIMPPRVVSL